MRSSFVVGISVAMLLFSSFFVSAQTRKGMTNQETWSSIELKWNELQKIKFLRGGATVYLYTQKSTPSDAGAADHCGIVIFYSAVEHRVEKDEKKFEYPVRKDGPVVVNLLGISEKLLLLCKGEKLFLFEIPLS